MKYKKPRNWKKGSISIYLCLSLCVILTLIAACMDSARLACGRGALACSMEEGMFSLFSNYDKTLYEKYGLLLLDTGYSGSSFQIGRLVDELTEDMEKVLSPADLLSGINAKKLYRISLNSSKITGYVLGTDENYKAIQNQIEELMTTKIGVDGLKKLGDKLSISVNALKKYGLEENQDINQLLTQYQEKKDAADEEAMTATEAEEADTEDFVNPLDNAEKILKMGFDSLFLPKGRELSQATVDTSSLLSSRSQNKGFGIFPKEEGSTQKLLLAEYGLDFYSNFLSTKEKSGLQYQTEYLIAGKSSDVDNLKYVIKRLLLFREGMNYLYLASDSSKKAKAETAATVISTMILCPEAQEAVTQLLMLLWAYVESAMDIKAILSGGNIPLFKDENSWQSSFDLLSSFHSDTEAERQEKGLSYEDYLRILLYCTSEQDLLDRTMNMLEYNKRIEDEKENFRLDNCLVAFQLEYECKIGRHKVTINRSYGYDM